MSHSDTSKRNCYCSLWEKSPETLIKQGVPQGYCGICDKCGQPGHIRHFPGAVPFTGAWCDRHYRMTMILHPFGAIGFFLWLAAVGLLVAGALALWALG